MGPTEPENNSITTIQAARMDFDRAHFKSFFREVLSFVTRTDNTLLPFDEIRKLIPLQGQHDIGIRQIPLDNIVGSVNRYNDFDRAFLPRANHTRYRWENIDRARMQDISLPPIEVYKIDEIYFVKDGNHRVSVARENGQVFIDAYVTEIDVKVEITPESNLEELILKQENAKFEEKTGIKELIPGCDIQLTQVGWYSTLLEHIDVHRYYMGERYDRAISYPDAVLSWYKKVYLPIVNIIRNRAILNDFPGQTEADVYLWIVTHQFFLMERDRRYVSFDQAAIHFVNKYSRKPLKRIRYWIRWLLRWLREVFGPDKLAK